MFGDFSKVETSPRCCVDCRFCTIFNILWKKCAYWRFPGIFPKMEISPLCCEDCLLGKISEILVQKSWIGDFRIFSGIFGIFFQSRDISPLKVEIEFFK